MQERACERADHAYIWLSQHVSSICVGPMSGKWLEIPPMDLIPAADMIPLSTSTRVGHLLLLAAGITSRCHLSTAVLHIH